ncbi:outer membrane beta-barrel protein [Dinghuibacter silviterrae]|uniref:Outer membrane protein with beta-barrel domain n=1 Tax=Dinghuibacter silviterrae TaxID=1539049 RepID=A0A4R8DQL6_9BACT|nr:outer membrane beta-barrel protein [Dinghuibacter silviterrae]TDX00442.1 outer membrane protein with beta-barrel domain [Dinghuibacter silviterrae]
MRHFLFVPILLFSLGAAAQTQTGRWDVSVSAGPAIPFGSFAKTSTTNANSQYALTGWDAQVQVNYKIITGINLSFLVGHQDNGFDNGQLYPPTNYSSYSSWRVMVGPSFRWFPGDQQKWAFTARILGGAQWSGSNEYQGFGDAPFTFQTGVGVQYNLTKRWYLTATGDIVTAKYKRTVNESTLTGPRSSINTGIGIGVSL